jgi:mannan endo-1,4-beta-mannosidase
MSAGYFLESHKTPNVDYLTFHLWPYNWGWFDPTHAEETLPVAEANSFAYIAGQIALARQLRKPIVMEEFGLGRDGGVTEAGSPTISRDRFYKNILTVIVDSARAGAPIAGSNFWAWGGEGRGQHADHMWRRGDPYVGDPPQEPQGLNSVFSTDTSTLRIIRRQALKMLQLSADDSLYAQRAP